jgi:hypothetical protein
VDKINVPDVDASQLIPDRIVSALLWSEGPRPWAKASILLKGVRPVTKVVNNGVEDVMLILDRPGVRRLAELCRQALEIE